MTTTLDLDDLRTHIGRAQIATDVIHAAPANMLRLALGLEVRHEVLPRNSMDHVSRMPRPASTPNALTPAEVNAVRVAIAYWEAGRSYAGPRPDGQLGAILEGMLGTSARIGEVLAIRRRDIDVTSATPVDPDQQHHRQPSC